MSYDQVTADLLHENEILKTRFAELTALVRIEPKGVEYYKTCSAKAIELLREMKDQHNKPTFWFTSKARDFIESIK